MPSVTDCMTLLHTLLLAAFVVGVVLWFTDKLHSFITKGVKPVEKDYQEEEHVPDTHALGTDSRGQDMGPAGKDTFV